MAKPGNKIGFKHSKTTKDKISDSMKEKNVGKDNPMFGKIPWNKGKKLPYEVWNKGTKGIMKAWNKGKKLSKEHIENRKKNHPHNKPWLGKKRPDISGENNYNWKGGEFTMRRGHEWQLIRKQVLIKFDFKCLHCGEEINLCIHHKIPYRKIQEHKIENLIPLCKSCHTKEEWKVQNLQEGKK